MVIRRRGPALLTGSLLVLLGLVSPLFGDVRYSPQLAVGSEGGLTAQVDVTAINISDLTQRVQMLFWKSDGTLINLTYTKLSAAIPAVTAVSVGSDLPAGAAFSANLSLDGDSTVGWIEFRLRDDVTGRDVIVQATFKDLDQDGNVVAAVGIPIRGSATDYVMPVEAGSVQDVGLASANPGT